jgi:hypothetical protein
VPHSLSPHARLKEKAKLLTSHLLEAAVEDIEYANGKFFVRGFPEKHKTIQDIALMANVAWNMPQGMEPGLEAEHRSTIRRTSCSHSARMSRSSKSIPKRATFN